MQYSVVVCKIAAESKVMDTKMNAMETNKHERALKIADSGATWDKQQIRTIYS